VLRYTRGRLKAIFREPNEERVKKRVGRGRLRSAIDYGEKVMQSGTTKKYPTLAAHAANCRIFNRLIGEFARTGKVRKNRLLNSVMADIFPRDSN